MNNIDIMWLAICIYHEARGEPEEGKVAVCHVILNRAYKRGLSVKKVVLQPYQFSWANNNKRPEISNYDALEYCFIAIDRCISERSNGEYFDYADHYFADYIKMPKWANNMKYIKKIGQHLFYRE